MDNYKEKLRSIAFSDPIYKKIEDISKRHDLTIDQMGDLTAEIRDVITEVVPTSEFTRELKERLEISHTKADEITKDVDTEIFKTLKFLMQQFMQIEEEVNGGKIPSVAVPVSAPKPVVAPIEKAGDFEVQRPTPSTSPIYKDTGLKREDVLRDLEGINNLKPENAQNYVEHLLTTPVVSPAPVPPPPAPVTPPPQPVVPPPPPKPTTPPPQKPPAPPGTVDPYREPI